MMGKALSPESWVLGPEPQGPRLSNLNSQPAFHYPSLHGEP